MATEIVGAQRRWTGSLDDEGHRTYVVTFQTRGNQYDGPQQHLITPGLPTAGSVYAIDNDIDVWAWCTGADKMTPRQGAGEVNLFYDHEFTFTTNPRGKRKGSHDDRGSRKKCSDITITNPLAEPPKRSGGTLKNTRERKYSKDGFRYRTTSFEPITGPQVEFDDARNQVVLEFNDVQLKYDTYKVLIDTVNDRTLWGLPARCWKLSEWHWDWKLYGICLFYVTHRFVFESNCFVNPKSFDAFAFGSEAQTHFGGSVVISGWDHYVPDVSTKALRGDWETNNNTTIPTWVLGNFGGTPPDFRDPRHYDIVRDRSGKGTTRVTLSKSTRGVPAVSEADELIWLVQQYGETDFLSAIPFLPSTL